ncbi:MAG: FAD-dependent oxidoreductase [Alphaproteobacteria bacterium]|nr:FAD-dependent oxidoreductase [Alphaproteobacteria bacterium]
MRICVIGGGAVGLFCAWRLALPGAHVTLVEPRPLVTADPTAASWAAAGMLGAVSECLGESAAALPARIGLGLRAVEAWRRAARDLAPAAMLFPVGTLTLGDTPDRDAALDALAEAATAAGAEVEIVAGAALAARGAPVAAHVARALVAPFEALVDIPTTLRTLATAAAAAGVRFQPGAAVAVTPSGDGLHVEVKHGAGAHATVTCDAVIAAPGVGPHARLAATIPALAHLAPTKGQMALLDATAPAVVRASGVYMAPRPEGLAIGATMEPGHADFDIDPEAIARLRAAAVRAAPWLAEAPVLRAWAGVRPMSPDGAPLVGPSGPPGCYVAAGHSRNGWLLAPLTAEIIADLVFGAGTTPAAFDPARFPPARS